MVVAMTGACRAERNPTRSYGCLQTSHSSQPIGPTLVDHAGNVVVSQDPSNSGHTVSRCHGCGTPNLKRKKRRLPDCGPIQLKLSRSAADRKHLRALIYASKLPQGEFAHYIMGVDQATLWRYLNGAVIPHSKAAQVRSIRHIERHGTDLQIVIRTCAERTRWNTMLLRRDRAWTE